MDIDRGKIRRLDFSLLLVFVELVRHERTTIVAQRLGLSQSAISHALTRLRAIFDDPLFIRRADGLTPTRRCRELAPKIHALMLLTQEALTGVSAFDPSASNRLFRLAANDLMVILFGTPLLEILTANAPNAGLTSRFAVGAEAFDALRKDKIDLALGRFYRVPDEFESIKLLQENFAVVARIGHPAIRDTLDLETYVKLEHLMVSFSGKLTGVVDVALARHNRKRRVRASMPMFLSAFAAVAASDLIATVPSRLANRLASGFGLQTFEPPIAIEGFPISLIRPINSRADAGLDWLTAQIRRVAAELSNPPSNIKGHEAPPASASSAHHPIPLHLRVADQPQAERGDALMLSPLSTRWFPASDPVSESAAPRASGLNRTLGTRPRPSSQLAEERRGPARFRTFGRSREGGKLP